jgi:hypothetical protein
MMQEAIESRLTSGFNGLRKSVVKGVETWVGGVFPEPVHRRESAMKEEADIRYG